jgi:sugar phosphate isomerase/epimerase
VIRLGLVSAILPELSLEQVLKVCAQEGYECVEVMCWPKGRAERRYAGVTHIDVNDLDGGKAERIREMVAASGVAISGLGYYPNPLSPDAAEAAASQAQLRAVIQAAPRLGLRNVNTFIGRDYTASLDDNWTRFRVVWPDLIKLAEDSGVKVGIENCPMSFTRDEWPGGKNLAISPAIWRRMFEEIPSDSFGLNYDPSHMIWQFMDPVRPLREFASKLFHIHAKDARIERERLNDHGILAYPNLIHTPKLPGLGEVPWGAFFAELTQCGYDGPVCVEVEDRAFEGSIEKRLLSVRQSRMYLRQFCPKTGGLSVPV